ncbi:PepSY domain-containing protein, partial [Sphingobium chlorophenolicum]|uniref:PepSY domain-containing protein n=1 Tax=Sphingobium chlorophenolicum TaxID=46429 RepID=UPI0020D261AC
MESGSFYRAMWRWHFYAGLIVLPVLALMAVTGALYLYKPEIERAVYHDRIVVRPGGAMLPPSRLVAAVEKASGGAVSQMQRPAA